MNNYIDKTTGGILEDKNAPFSWSGVALALGTAFAGGHAQAATFTVTNLADAGGGSLRQAILDANGAAGADTITFQAGLTGTITLTLSITHILNGRAAAAIW
ncbi:MAG: hypothetical protein P9F19_05990 [Candidatus Contendobacter sp.]|nr:hypothetical protein [Candidatus Contendobacter sp.]MDG4556927.1 hypothetical protein [Candidatus Contendobacter sp.]